MSERNDLKSLPLRIIKFERRLARVILISAALICVAAAWFFIRWNFANAIASTLDPARGESRIIADWLTQLAPSDPQTHMAAGHLFERTFDAGDLERSLAAYETAVAMSPHHYVMWLNLGKARSVNGDIDGAIAAYEQAMELAPNYSSVQWVYGNALIRQGNTSAGFALVAKAAAKRPDYAAAAAVTALQIFDGNLDLARQALGDTNITNAALATTLAGQTRFDEAFEAWSRLPQEDKADSFRRAGEILRALMVTAKKYVFAAQINADLETDEGKRSVIGQISNGGFENGVKLNDAKLFEWQIADGPHPQIGLGEGQSHSGRHNLLMIFNTFDTAAFRAVSQTVAVAPGAEYEFELFYRSDLKTPATLKWDIADAGTGIALATTPAMAPAGAWTRLNVRFRVPADSDGVVVRLVRDGCAGPACPMNGRLSFDDLLLRRL